MNYKELNQSRKGLINIDDKECLKWYLFRHLNPLDHHLTEHRKIGKDFPRKSDFKITKRPVKMR